MNNNSRFIFLILLLAFIGFSTVFVEVASAVPTAERRFRLAHPPVLEVSESYYRTIIENNLFRPLGWTPPRPKEPYRLLGTLLPTDDRTPPKAILQTTAGHQTYIVTTGEKIDASTEVVEIKPKQVTLSTKGQQRTLHLPVGF